MQLWPRAERSVEVSEDGAVPCDMLSTVIPPAKRPKILVWAAMPFIFSYLLGCNVQDRYRLERYDRKPLPDFSGYDETFVFRNGGNDIVAGSCVRWSVEGTAPPTMDNLPSKYHDDDCIAELKVGKSYKMHRDGSSLFLLTAGGGMSTEMVFSVTHEEVRE